MQLEEHPFIATLSDELRASLLEDVEFLEMSPNTIIFEEQSEPDTLFLILEGSVAFTKRKRDGSHREISQAVAGGFFGEVGILSGQKRALGAKTREYCRIACLPEPSVQQIIKYSEPVQKILYNVIHHLEGTTTHYMDEVMRTEKLALVGSMVSSILHDFKNPFSMISLGATLIQQNYPEDPKTVRICEGIQSQIQRMVTLANELTAFSRGEHEIKIETVSIETLFQMFRELNSPYFNDQSVRLILSANATTLQADISKLLRVLQNLVGNAIDALHECDIEGQIEVSAQESGNWLTLKIADNGPGIPIDIRDNFFEPFVTRGKNDGTGLGAAIVKSIIESHHGSIEFETNSNGTTFLIKLPKIQEQRS